MVWYFKSMRRVVLLQYVSNPTIEGREDVTNLSPGEDRNSRKATPPGDRVD